MNKINSFKGHSIPRDHSHRKSLITNGNSENFQNLIFFLEIDKSTARALSLRCQHNWLLHWEHLRVGALQYWSSPIYHVIVIIFLLFTSDWRLGYFLFAISSLCIIRMTLSGISNSFTIMYWPIGSDLSIWPLT